MSDSRVEVLQRIRGALKRTGPAAWSVQQSLHDRIASHRISVRPIYGEEVIARFLNKHVAVHGTYDWVDASNDVMDAVVAYLDRHSIAPKVVTGSGSMIDSLSWPNEYTVERRPAVKLDKVTISEAFVGIAETGTLVLLSAPSAPASHNYLPDDQIVLLDIKRVVRYQEDVWTLLRDELARLPRTVSLITGPSKTGDVEQTIEYGAHGPRRLHIILIGS